MQLTIKLILLRQLSTTKLWLNLYRNLSRWFAIQQRVFCLSLSDICTYEDSWPDRPGLTKCKSETLIPILRKYSPKRRRFKRWYRRPYCVVSDNIIWPQGAVKTKTAVPIFVNCPKTCVTNSNTATILRRELVEDQSQVGSHLKP